MTDFERGFARFTGYAKKAHSWQALLETIVRAAGVQASRIAPDDPLLAKEERT
jgi:hypothetical protein